MRYLALAVLLALAAAPGHADDPPRYPYRNNAGKPQLRIGGGATLAVMDPAVSTTLDSGVLDTAGCTAGCLSALVEVETATTLTACDMYGIGGGDDASSANDHVALITSFQVSASSKSWAGSVCPGVGTGFGAAAALPKHVRLLCGKLYQAPAIAGVNLRGFMACH